MKKDPLGQELAVPMNGPLKLMLNPVYNMGVCIDGTIVTINLDYQRNLLKLLVSTYLGLLIVRFI